jgi:hypothetical protein
MNYFFVTFLKIEYETALFNFISRLYQISIPLLEIECLT